MPVVTWIEEFLYRGRPPSGPGSEMDATFHVIVRQMVESPFGPQEPPSQRSLGPLTPEQAQALGQPLAALVAGINTAAIEEMNIARSERDQAREERDVALNKAHAATESTAQLQTQNEVLATQLAEAVAGLEQSNALLDQARSELALLGGQSAAAGGSPP